MRLIAQKKLILIIRDPFSMRPKEKKTDDKVAVLRWQTVGTLFVILLLPLVVFYFRYFHTNKPSLYSDRVQERIKAANEVNSSAQTSINEFSWVDKDKGILHIPISNAMSLIDKIYKNKETARTEFLKRIESANNNINIPKN